MCCNKMSYQPLVTQWETWQLEHVRSSSSNFIFDEFYQELPYVHIAYDRYKEQIFESSCIL